MRLRPFFFACVVLALAAATVNADISLGKIFSDHMVVQRNAQLTVWGNANPNESLTVSFGSAEKQTTSNAAGSWSTTFKTGAAGGPYELIVASNDREVRIVIKDVLVGEVWLCCGQDQMEMPIAALSDAQSLAENSEAFPNVRLFGIENHQASQPQKELAKVRPWASCCSESIHDFSAIGYLFGLQLHQQIDVPIGLIDAARSATTLESWTPYRAMTADDQRFQELLKHWEELNQPNSPNRPSNNYNAMLAPLTRFPVAGVIWMHGEANIGRGSQYAELFPAMIKAWRREFTESELPFYFVQPMPTRYENFSVEALPEIWDAQFKTFTQVPQTAMVVAADIAEPNGPQETTRAELAHRLARWVVTETYRQPFELDSPKADAADEKQVSTLQPPETESTAKDDIAAENETTANQAIRQLSPSFSGPVFDRLDIVGNEIQLTFRFADGGLKLAQSDETGFLICGSDKQFRPANAEIRGDKLIVSHPDLKKPIAVRYGWKDTFRPTLSNSDGLPASPFRTDKFPLQSFGVNF